MTVSIELIHAREVFDSRGRPTVEVDVTVAGGWQGRGMVPSGASTGRHEALELRDGDRSHYGGLGVRGAVRNVNEVIAPKIIGKDALNQQSIDETLIALDGTPNKERLGANALLGVSVGVAQAAAAASRLPLWRYLGGPQARTLPLPIINIISGGLHAAHNLDFQDFMIVATGARSYSQALEISAAVRRSTGELLLEGGLSILKADEGGFGPKLANHREALDLLMNAIERAGYKPGADVSLALDVAASHFFNPERALYLLYAENKYVTSEELVAYLAESAKQYPIVFIEDGLAEDDWEGWEALTVKLGDSLLVVGDDLFTTNAGRLQRGIETCAANAVLVKINQIGTLTETLKVIEMAKESGFRPIISARSGETEDSFVADLAVATNAGQVKIGSLAQSDRLAKYNQLLRIEETLGKQAQFAGREVLEPATLRPRDHSG